VFAWQAIEGALNLFLSAFRQSTLVLVFDTYCHKKSVTVGEGRESGQVTSSTDYRVYAEHIDESA